MGSPQRESDDVGKDYRSILWLAGRDAQDFSLNEMQAIFDRERERLAGSVWKQGAIVSGLQPSLPGNGQLALSAGAAYLFGRIHPLDAATLAFAAGGATTAPITSGASTVPIGADPTTKGFAATGTAYLARAGLSAAFSYTGVTGTGFTGVSGVAATWPAGTGVFVRPVETAYARWLMDQVTYNEDPTLKSPSTGDVVEERVRVRATLATSSPDAFDERFEDWDDAGLPRNWTLISGGLQRGTPAKFGAYCAKLVHTTGTQTSISRIIQLAAGTAYTVYFQVRTADGQSDLGLGDGAYVRFNRVSPAWNPADYVFATSATYARKTFGVTADANADPVTLSINIPASAPSTQLLVDALLVTTSQLAALELDRHYTPLLFWDRDSGAVTPAISRASNVRMAQLEPPLSGLDIVDIDLNPGLLDWAAITAFDELGHFRVPPGLTVSRDTSRDSSTQLGLLVAAGRAYVLGYRVSLPTVKELLVDKATDAAGVNQEGQAYAFGTFLYPLNKSVGVDLFPIKQITEVDATVEVVLPLTRGGTPNSADPLGILNALSIQSATAGTAAQVTGSAAGPFAFDETNNTLKLVVTDYDGTAGATQTIVFARGTYTCDEVVQALMLGTGRAYRSGKILGDIVFENDGAQHLRMRTKSRSSTSTITTDSTGNSPANAVFGFTASTATSGTGTRYAQTADWVRSGNSIDWAPGGAEPGGGTTFYVTARYVAELTQGVDYKLGGVFAAAATYFYKVAAWGASGEGIPSAAVSRATAVGDVNALAWSPVTNAISYHIYRSADGGTTYNFLKNVTGTSFLDDGSLTPDSTKHPSTTETTTDGVLAGGETTVTVVATAGFPSGAQTAFLAGADIFTYTGLTGTTFTGVPASGGNAVVAHASGVTCRLGPDMGPLTLALDNVGVTDFSLQGLRPVDGTTFNVSYDYYQHRVDRIALDRYGSVTVTRGIPADSPLPAALPSPLLELAQVQAQANSTTLAVTNLSSYDRITARELRALIARVNTLAANDASQQILNAVATRTTAAKKGLFADAFASFDNSDTTHPSYATLVETMLLSATVPPTLTQPALAVNGGATTAALLGQKYYLPSTEVTLLDQAQWSEEMLVNPYSVFTPPVARLVVNPDRMRWAIGSGNQDAWRAAAATATLILAQATSILNLPPHTTPPGLFLLAEQAIPIARDVIRRALQVSAEVILTQIQLQVDGANFAPSEDNIVIKFAGVQATGLSGFVFGSAGTDPDTVKADSTGRFECRFTVPASIAAGTKNVQAVGPLSDATATFTGLTVVIPPPPSLSLLPSNLGIDPLAESFGFPVDATVSGFGLWFTAKDPTVPITVQVRPVVNGFPGPDVIQAVVLNPSQITLDAETKVALPDYLFQPAGTTYAVTLLSSSNLYKVQVATLGAVGRNPNQWITANPYDRGVLFSSANAESWTVHGDKDLRFRIYGRQFSASAQLEFSSASGSWSDLWLGAEQDVPSAAAALTWEYELNGDGVTRPFEPFSKRLLDAQATSVILRAKLSTSDPDVSPSITLPGVGLAGFLNATTGAYVSRMVQFSQGLTKATAYVYVYVPSTTSVAFQTSNDDGATWETMSLDAAADLDGFWQEYTLSRIYTDSAKSKFRIRANFTAATPMVIPRIGHLGVTLE